MSRAQLRATLRAHRADFLIALGYLVLPLLLYACLLYTSRCV